jgi:ABC-type branched-subunit amino acid transport system substrate-binding protein
MAPPRGESNPSSERAPRRALGRIIEEHAPLDGPVAARLGILLARALEARGAASKPLAPSSFALDWVDGTLRVEVLDLTTDRASTGNDAVASLGRILFEALSGRTPPEPGFTAADLVRVAPWIEAALAGVVARAACGGTDAIASLGELATSLEPYAGDEAGVARLVAHTAHEQADAAADAEEAPRPPGASPGDGQRPEAWIGRAIGRFRIGEVLGQGGMATVFGATAEDGTEVAIKVMRPDASPATLRRFVREARWASRIESPHLTRVLDVTCDESAPVLTLERMRGRDLASVLATDGPLEPSVAARILADACLGLAAAHEAGVIHRDLKPSNIFLHEEENGTITTKICDFGVAKLGGELHVQERALTRAGGLLGTPAYMSPEQARDARNVDVRTDVWSLGATLYEALSGRRPWHGAANVGDILAALSSRHVPRLDALAPWVDRALAAVVDRCLARDPSARIASAAALREELLPFATKEPLLPLHLRRDPRGAPSELASPAPATASTVREADKPKPRRGWPSAVLGGFAAATLVGLLAAALREPQRPAPSPAAATCPGAKVCTQTLGEPARCGPSGACVALGSAQCTVDADPAAIESDHTLWIGAMFPADHDDAYTASFGRGATNAASLAVHEITSVSGGVPVPDGHPLPVGLVACKDAKDPTAAARHLVESVGVPAVIGFGSGKSVVELSSSLFLKEDVLAVASINSSALLSSIPHPPDRPRLVFRTAANTATRAAALAKIIPEAIEPRLRSRPGSTDRDLRVGVVVRQTSAGIAFSEALAQNLSFNGRSVRDNGPSFSEVRLVGENEASMKPALAASALLAAAPDLVVIQDTSDIVVGGVIVPLEDRWDAARGPRPTYLLTGSIEAEAVGELLRRHPTVGERLLGITPPWQTPANVSFTRAYNAAFREKLSEAESPGAPYDSVYLVAYAASIASDPTSGASLSRALARLSPPGEPIQVGPTGWLDGTARLARGERVDLFGTFSRLDFDPQTGESPTDYALVCGQLREDTLAISAAGVLYDAGKGHVVGTLGCGVPN